MLVLVVFCRILRAFIERYLVVLSRVEGAKTAVLMLLSPGKSSYSCQFKHFVA